MPGVRTHYDVNALTLSERALLHALETHPTVEAARQSLGIEARTAINRIRTICEKLGVETAQEAVEKWSGQTPLGEAASTVVGKLRATLTPDTS